LRLAVPGRASADGGGELLLLAFGGERADGSAYVTGEIIASGSGASNGKDGVDVIETDVTNCMNLPVEALEMDAPIRVHRSELSADSGGAGAYRGGLGLVREYEVLQGDVVFTYRGERHAQPAAGYAGGGAGARAHAEIIRRDGGTESIDSKLVTRLAPGDRVKITTAGGGGYGPPEERAPEHCAADLADGKISGR
jgi:N-methylhydantoinase B/oxoprolinase/acetone carboxylase alpha subunit